MAKIHEAWIEPPPPSTRTLSPVTAPIRTHAPKVQLRRSAYRLVWAAMVLVSLINGGTACMFALLYYAAFTIRDGYYLAVVGMSPSLHVPTVVIIYAGLVLHFWLDALYAIATSLRHRRLTLTGDFRTATQRLRGPLGSSEGLWSTPPYLRALWGLVTRRLVTPLVRLLGLRHRVVVHGGGGHDRDPDAAFESIFLAREVLEITMQSYQVYKSSTLLSQTWITDFYVGVLVINCWIAPVIHFGYHAAGASFQRFLYLWSDVALDLISVLVIPACVLLTLILVAFRNALEVSGGQKAYAFDVPYDDVFLTNTFNGARQICALNWLDLFSKLLPLLSMAVCLSSLKSLVTTAPMQAAAVANNRWTEVVPLEAEPPPPAATIEAQRVPSFTSRARRPCIRLTHVAFAFWGLVLLAVHLRSVAVRQSAPATATQGCKSSAQPWFVERFACTTLEINCHRRGLTGTRDEIDGVLAAVDAQSVTFLIITHCPQLAMPPRVRDLGNVFGIEITNCTIEDWSEDAALSSTAHPILMFFQLVRTNMTTLPVGLQAPDFPASVRMLCVVGSNLTRLPDNLHTRWRHLINLYVEWNAGLGILPPTIASMRVSRLSLLGNGISWIPDDAFRGNRLSTVSVAKNPLRAWPAALGATDDLHLVLMDDTLIEELPSWLVVEGRRRRATGGAVITVSAGGSPLCLGGPPEPAPEGLAIVCRPKSDDELEGLVTSYSLQTRIL